MNPGYWNQSGIKLGKTQIDSGVIPLFLILGGLRLCQLIAIIAYLLFVIRGFRVHWGWGLVNFLFFPLGSLIFLIKHPRHGKLPAMILLAVPGLILLLFVLLFLGAEFA
jgi:4-amino-4-deoxy-L-arabinose transferase-like glycosyltransferase